MEATVDQKLLNLSTWRGQPALEQGEKIMGPWDLRGGSILYGKAPSLWIFFVIKDPMALVQRFFRRQQTYAMFANLKEPIVIGFHPCQGCLISF